MLHVRSRTTNSHSVPARLLSRGVARVALSVLACLAFLALGITPATSGQSPDHDLGVFRTFPYLVSPGDSSVVINWFTKAVEPGSLRVRPVSCGGSVGRYESSPTPIPALEYTDAALADTSRQSVMFANRNVKHSVRLSGLTPGCQYHYRVQQARSSYRDSFRTGPKSGGAVRFVAFADSETGPKGRTTHRRWLPGAQGSGSTGRPDSVQRYFLTEFEGFRRNLDVIQQRNPDFLLISGDIVQGGGYQRAWDEFFLQTAGRFGQVFGSTPVVPALGNWENVGGPYGGYNPEAVARGRAKFLAYFDAPPNNNPRYRGAYYRIDYGPVTVLTLDSSNGLPDSTDRDTNININASTYPADDLPDVNPGSDQWNWVVEQLRTARETGQVVFVQFHHPPYTAGYHSLPLTVPGSSGQAGVPMQAYMPLFRQHGVAAVFSGHNESFSHSVIGGVHFYDVGVAGDGFGFPLDTLNKQYAWWQDFLEKRPTVRRHQDLFRNPHRVWSAHHDAQEVWSGAQLVDGGKHYGHLEVNVTPVSGREAYRVRLTPVYVFPVTDESGTVVRVERRIYEDQSSFTVDTSADSSVQSGAQP